MVFKGPAGYGRILNTFMNIIICGVMTYYVMYLNQQANPGVPILTPPSYIAGLVSSFCVGYYIGDTVPGWRWGTSAAVKLGIQKERKLLGFIVCCVVHAFCMCTLIPLVCDFINVFPLGGFAGVAAAFTGPYFVILGIGFVLMLVFMPIAMKLATAISGFDPSTPPPRIKNQLAKSIFFRFLNRLPKHLSIWMLHRSKSAPVHGIATRGLPP